MRGVRRAVALLASVVTAALGGLVLTLTAAGPLLPEASAAGACRVTSASLTWGFKASFRAYITSSIANGTWTTSGNARYATPNFIWRDGTGTFDAASTTGQISFSGGVRFTGHEGQLDSRFSNLRLKFTNATTAVLVLDYTGVSMAGATSGSATPKTYSDVSFVNLGLTGGTRSAARATTTFTSVPTSITAAGYAAFGSYPAGTAFDPMTISITTDAACAAPAVSQTKPKTSTAPASAAGTTRAGGDGARPTTAAAHPTTAAATTRTDAGTKPSIVAATGLQIPANAATSTTTGSAGGSGSAAEPADGSSPTRTLGVLASADSRGSSGNGLLFALAGLAVGIGATLLIQFAHVHLLAKRKAAHTG